MPSFTHHDLPALHQLLDMVVQHVVQTLSVAVTGRTLLQRFGDACVDLCDSPVPDQRPTSAQKIKKPGMPGFSLVKKNYFFCLAMILSLILS